MDLYFLCLAFQLDISNMLKTKYIANTGYSAGHRGEKIQFGNPFKFGFPNHSPCDVITLFPPNKKGIPELMLRFI